MCSVQPFDCVCLSQSSIEGEGDERVSEPIRVGVAGFGVLPARRRRGCRNRDAKTRVAREWRGRLRVHVASKGTCEDTEENGRDRDGGLVLIAVGLLHRLDEVERMGRDQDDGPSRTEASLSSLFVCVRE